jgi:hypothetical protein
VSWYDGTRRSQELLRRPADRCFLELLSGGRRSNSDSASSDEASGLEANHDTGVRLLHLGSSVCKLTGLVEIWRDEEKAAVSRSR